MKIGEVSLFFGGHFRQVGVHEAIQVPVHYPLNVGSLAVGAQILYKLVGHEYVRPYLVPPGYVPLLVIVALKFRALFVHFNLIEPGLEHLHRRHAVLVL